MNGDRTIKYFSNSYFQFSEGMKALALLDIFVFLLSEACLKIAHGYQGDVQKVSEDNIPHPAWNSYESDDSSTDFQSSRLSVRGTFGQVDLQQFSVQSVWWHPVKQSTKSVTSLPRGFNLIFNSLSKPNLT